MVRYFLYALVLSMLPAAAHAGAWVLPKKQRQYIVSMSYYSADRYFDAKGKKQSQKPYVKKELSLYHERGLREWLTLGGQMSFAHVINRKPTYEVYSLQLGDSEAFARAALWRSDNAILSAQPYFAINSPNEIDNRVTIGSDSYAVGMRLQYGRSFKAFGNYHYTDVGMAYNHRLRNPSDQLKFDATLGLRLSRKWETLGQLFITKSTKKIRSNAFTQTSADDYDATKGQLTLQYNFTEKTALQLSGFADIDGKNSGAGRGVSLGMVMRF